MDVIANGFSRRRRAVSYPSVPPADWPPSKSHSAHCLNRVSIETLHLCGRRCRRRCWILSVAAGWAEARRRGPKLLLVSCRARAHHEGDRSTREKQQESPKSHQVAGGGGRHSAAPALHKRRSLTSHLEGPGKLRVTDGRRRKARASPPLSLSVTHIPPVLRRQFAASCSLCCAVPLAWVV